MGTRAVTTRISPGINRARRAAGLPGLGRGGRGGAKLKSKPRRAATRRRPGNFSGLAAATFVRR